MTPVLNYRTYILDHARIKTIREQRKIDLLELALRADLREPPKSRVSGETLLKIVAALDCSVDDIIVGPLIGDWHGVSDIRRKGQTPNDRVAERSDRDKFRRAIYNNMKEYFDASLEHIEDLLERIPPTEPVLRAIVRRKKIDLLDDAGRLEDALVEANRLLRSLNRQKLGVEGEEIAIWAKISRGRVLHRLRHFDAARAALEDIRDKYVKPYRTLAIHQLGVAALMQYHDTDAGHTLRRAQLLDDAKRHFETAIAEWSTLEKNYRIGFSHRRIAEVYAIRNQHSEAIYHRVEALNAFARFDCIRYQKRAQEALYATIDAALEQQIGRQQ